MHLPRPRRPSAQLPSTNEPGSRAPLATGSPSSGAAAPPALAGAGLLVAGRYRTDVCLHVSEASEVWRATDELTGRAVVLKLLPECSSAPQLRAEVSALRLLHLPGVARLVDEGRHGRRPFLAMELVEGTPFPGVRRADGVRVGSSSQSERESRPDDGRRTWAELRSTTLALFEVVARVHDRGVVHRDLKPDNVLVDDRGRPVVLDFGLSAGAAIGSGRGPETGAVGTPAYAAPEQILGEAVDARADLYALGVMLYEALAGRPPQTGRVADEFLQARLHGTPDSLALHAPQVPRHVAALVDELLARDPRDRPRSAADVLATLRGGAPLAGEPELPWLGAERDLDAALDAVLAARPVEVLGRRGSGKSRFLRELARRLATCGRCVVEVTAERAPLASLSVLFHESEEPADIDLERALALARSRVAAVLASGDVLFVDEWDALDRWSLGVLEEFRRAPTVPSAGSAPASGTLVVTREDDRGAPAQVDPASVGGVRVDTNGLCIRLGAFEEESLRALFAGPDRLFHLREDGARELWRRTLGHPARVADEVSAWERAGLARWSGSRLAADRRALSRLGMGLSVSPPERSTALRVRGGAGLPEHLEEHLAWTTLAGSGATTALLARARDLSPWQVEAERLELVDAGALRPLAGGGAEALVYPRALAEWTPEARAAAEGRLADLLPEGAEGRLLHLISAGRFSEVHVEARALARRLVDEGRLAEAEAALTEGLAAVRHAGDLAAELELLAEWFAVALADFTPQAVDRVVYELSRARAARGTDSGAWPGLPAARAGESLDTRSAQDELVPFAREGARISAREGEGWHTELARLEHFGQAALATLEGGGEGALVLVEAVPPFEDLELERWRLALRVQAARGASAGREAAVFAELERAWGDHPSPLIQAGLAEWQGRLCYREDRHLEAAEHFERAVALGTRVSARLSAMLNGAAALLEADRHERAAVLAGRARDLAAECRHTLFEVRAEWILRAAAYRRGLAGAPDLELADAASRVGMSDQEALICLTEAAVAWRAGDSRAVDLAQRAASLWSTQGKQWGTLLARALAAAASPRDRTDLDELDELVRRAAECPEAYLAGQCLALAVRAGAAPHPRASEVCAALRVAFPAECRSARREVLSIVEILDALE